MLCLDQLKIKDDDEIGNGDLNFFFVINFFVNLEIGNIYFFSNVENEFSLLV